MSLRSLKKLAEVRAILKTVQYRLSEVQIDPLCPDDRTSGGTTATRSAAIIMLRPVLWRIFFALFLLTCFECDGQCASANFLLGITLLFVCLQKSKYILFYLVVLLCASRECARLLHAVNAGGERRHHDFQWTTPTVLSSTISTDHATCTAVCT